MFAPDLSNIDQDTERFKGDLPAITCKNNRMFM